MARSATSPVQLAGPIGVALLLVAAWLLVPRSARRDAAALPPLDVLVVDVSASVTRPRPEWSPWIRARLGEAAREARAEGADCALLLVAADVRRAFGPGPADDLLDLLEGRSGRPLLPLPAPGRELGSELASACAAVDALLAEPGRTRARVRLWTDARATGAAPDPWLGAWRGHGIAVALEPLPPPRLADAALRALRVPPMLKQGAPLAVRVEVGLMPGDEPAPGRIGAAGAAAAEVVVEVRAGGLAQTQRVRVEPMDPSRPERRGTARVELGVPPPGRLRVEARVRLADGRADALPENDRAEAIVRCGGGLALGLVATRAERAAARRWLEPGADPGSGRDSGSALAGVDVTLLDPAGLVAALPDLDLVATFDVGVHRLPADALEDFVQGGGGWLAACGWSLLDGWSALAADGTDALLPLEADRPDDDRRDVVLLVDGSGSMEGEPFDRVRAAAIELVGSAPPGDAVALRLFTAVLGSEHRVRERLDGARTPDREELLAPVRELLAARVPGGSTEILGSLRAFATERARASTRCLAILLTDGRESGEVPQPYRVAAEVLADLREAGVELRVVAVGANADRSFLEHLVAAGDELLVSERLDDLGALFRREVHRDGVREGSIETREAEGGALAAELRQGRPLPPLARVVRARARPGAETLWTDADGAPLLAAWRVGRGRTAAWASLPEAAWAPAWVDRPELVGPLLRWLGRGARARGPELDVEDGALVLTGVPPDWPARVHARVLRAPGDAPGDWLLGEGARELGTLWLLPRTTGGADPRLRRSAPLPAFLESGSADRAAGDGGLEVELARPGPDGGQGERLAVVPLVLPVPPELLVPALALGDLGGPGGADGPARAPAVGGAPRPHPAAPWLLGTGLLAVLAAGAGGVRARRTARRPGS